MAVFLFLKNWSKIIWYFVGNKAKWWISKRVFQENKARQIFRKTNISYPLIRTRAYQGIRNVRFSENLACFVFLKPVLRFARDFDTDINFWISQKILNSFSRVQIWTSDSEINGNKLEKFGSKPREVFCKKKVFLKILQISQENTCTGVTF